MSDRKKRGGDDGGHGEEAWLLPYADMITLLLGLFIVLFAMSSLDVAKFNEVSTALSKTFRGSVLENSGGTLPGSDGVLDPQAANESPDNTTLAFDTQMASDATSKRFEKEQNRLDKMAKELGGVLDGKIIVSQDARGIVINVEGDALFDSGSAALREPSLGAMQKIANELKRFGAPIEIEGHTDGAPYEGPYIDNFGLSGARANTVLRLFQSSGIDGERLSAVARGEFDPMVKPVTKTASVAKNRRVEIHVLAPGQGSTVLDSARERAAQRQSKPLVSGTPATKKSALAKPQASAPAAPAARQTNSTASSNWGGVSSPDSQAPDLVTDVIQPIVTSEGNAND